MNDIKKPQLGFSLIELSIVIIISGILLSGVILILKQSNEKKEFYEAQAKIEIVTQAMNRFFSTYGRFPCVASRSATVGDANFGVATSCYNESVLPGGCNADYCVSEADIIVDGVPVTRRVRTGAVPFRTLKEGIEPITGVDEVISGVESTATFEKYLRITAIGVEDVIDAQKNQLTYTVTEYQARDEYLPRLGAITVRDEHPNGANSILTANADYVLVSHGENGGGARTLSGTQFAGGCAAPLSNNEQENCDNDAVFISSLRYDTGSNQFDDSVTYRTRVRYFLWDKADNNDENIYNLNAGNVGVGVIDPEEKLHIFEGNVLVEDGNDPALFPVPNSGTVMAQEYCNEDGSDCFDPVDIADESGTAGIECDPANPFNVMIGVSNGQANCVNLFDSNSDGVAENQNLTCGVNGAGVQQFLRGVRYNIEQKRLETICEAP